MESRDELSQQIQFSDFLKIDIRVGSIIRRLRINLCEIILIESESYCINALQNKGLFRRFLISSIYIEYEGRNHCGRDHPRCQRKAG